MLMLMLMPARYAMLDADVCYAIDAALPCHAYAMPRASMPLLGHFDAAFRY